MKSRGFLTLAAMILVGAIVLTVVSSRTPSGTATSSETISVSLRLPIPVVDAAFAPYYLAVDKGIFERHGLKVKIEPGTSELNPVKMLSQNTDQFAVLGGPELLFSARAKDAPIIGIAQIHKDSDFVVLLSLKDSGITKPKQLDGKKVGFFFGHISTDIIRMLLAKEGVAVEEVDVGFDYGQLLTGQLSAQWAFRTTAGISLPARGIDINVISPADYGLRTQGHILVTNERTANERPEVVQRFLEAVIEATEYSIDNIDLAVDSCQMRDPNFSAEIGRKQLESYNPSILRNSKIGWISLEDMEITKQQMTVAELLPADFDVDAAFNAQFLRDYYKQ